MKAGLLGLLAAFSLCLVAFPPPANAQQTATVVPLVDCVEHNPARNTLTAHFGYINTGTTILTIPYGPNNLMHPGQPVRSGQPTLFQPGRHDRAWSTTLSLSASSELTWSLLGVEATAANDPDLYCPPTPNDLSLTQSATPDPVLAGEELTYALTVDNDDADRASGVRLTDLLPDGADFVSASATQGSCSGTNPLTCELGSLDASGSATVTVVVRPQRAGTLTNAALVGADDPDPDPVNNSASSSVDVVAPPSATTGPADDLSTVGADLSAFVDPNGSATTYSFEYGTTEAYGQNTAGQPAGPGPGLVQATLDGLRPDTTYHYRVVASNEHGTARGSDRTFTTSALVFGRLTLSARPSVLKKGRATTLSGTLTNATGAALAGEEVTLQRRRVGASGFAAAGSATTGPDGRFAFKGVRPGKTTRYRVAFSGDEGIGTKASVSPIRRVFVR